MPDAETLLDDVVTAFESRVAELNFRHFSSMKYFGHQHDQITDLLDQYSSIDVDLEKVFMGSRTYFSDIGAAHHVLDLSKEQANLVPLKGRVAKGNELYENLNNALNDQLSWILVGLFEAHERFLKDLYAAIGYLDSGLWAKRHLTQNLSWKSFFTWKFWFGPRDPRPSEYKFYSQEARSISSHNCDGILTQLRKAFPRFARFEQTKWINQESDFAIWRSIVELFRHLIVHQHGEDHERLFWKSVRKRTGRSVTGKKQKVATFRLGICSFLVVGDGRIKIRLIKDSMVGKTKQHANVDGPFKKLFEAILNQSFLAYREAITHFGSLPYWCRTESAT